MKNGVIYILSILIFISCSYENKDKCKKGKPDKKYEFLNSLKRKANYNYLEYITDIREFGSAGSLTNFKWLRKPENLEVTYNSIKKVGLFNFISRKEYQKPLFTEHYAETCWENKSLKQINENLIKCYSDTTGFEKYYQEFWKRRIKENNQKSSYKILVDIKNVYSGNEIKKNGKPINKIISKLYEYEIKLKNSDSTNIEKISIDYFNFLKKNELFSSAVNLLKYMKEYEYINTDITKLIESVEKDSVSCEKYWNWRYKAKWFKEIYDDAP